MWWIWLVIAVVVVGALVALWFICVGRRSSSESERPRAEMTQETGSGAHFIAPKATGWSDRVPVQSEIAWMTQENPVFDQDVSGSEIYLDNEPSGGEGQARVLSGGPRFPLVPEREGEMEASTDGGEAEVWGTVTLTKRLFAQQGSGTVEQGGGRADDDELKYEEEGGELDDGGLPEGPDDELDGDEWVDDQEQDGGWAYDDDQAPGEGDVADSRPWDVGGEFQFDPRVDDRYFQHSSDDEVGLDPPTSDEFDPDLEDEPLRL
jgi:hypothetical protein